NAMTPNEQIYPADTDADLLPVVDENDVQIDVLPRREVHLQRLRHRAVHVGVFDDDGNLWLQRRSRKKDTWPGAWDISASGHVDPGESYEDAARRELLEELGIEATPRYIATHPATEATGWEFQAVFWVLWKGPIRNFARKEIERVRRFAIDRIENIL